MEFLDNLQRTLEQYLSNPYILAITKLFIILYSCLVAPTLPVEILGIFDNVLVKILVLTLIFYSASIEPMMAVLLGVGLFVTLQTLNNVKLLNLVNDQIEGLENEENTEETPANEVPQEEGCYPAVTITEEDNNELKSYEGEDFSKF